MADQSANNIGWRMQEDKSILFDIRDGVTVHADWDSPTQMKVEFWRDSDGVIVPPDVGNIGSKSFRDKLVKTARGYFNPPPGKDKKQKDTVPCLNEDLGHVATLLGIPEVAALLKKEDAPTLADRLVELVEDSGELFVTPEGRAHVTLGFPDSHTETLPLDDDHFETWLRGHFYATEKKRLEEQAAASYERMIDSLGSMAVGQSIPVRRPATIRAQTVTDAVSQLVSMALFAKRVEHVHLRGAAHGEKIYLDLCNDAWEAIEIDADGWRIIQNPPVRFVRVKGQLPLPYPTRGGSVEELRGILTFTNTEEDEKAWRLVLAWLIQALRFGREEYPVLVLLGGHGTGKSTTSRLVRSIIDPSEVMDIRKPKTEEEVHIDAENSWILALDNVSGLQGWVSDVVCRISTGSAMTKRTLYSNRGREIFKAARPQILNGISEVATAGDLLRRSLLINLPLVEENIEKEEIFAELEERRPGILGALLDAVSSGLKSIANGDPVTDRLPDMADFSKWAIRTERALGGERGSFMEAYKDAHGEATATILESEPICATLLRFVRSYEGRDNAWVGTVGELRTALNDVQTDEDLKRSDDWPKTPRALGSKLTRVKPALAEEGIHIEDAPKSAAGKRRRVYFESSVDTAVDTAVDGAPDEDVGEV